jgi:hypothetical protein
MKAKGYWFRFLGFAKDGVHQEVRIPLGSLVPLSPSPFLKLTKVK